jgi:hypothetical protein
MSSGRISHGRVNRSIRQLRFLLICTRAVAFLWCIANGIPNLRGQDLDPASPDASYFIGIWQKTDVNTQRVIATVEFKENGQSIERDNTETGQRTFVRDYAFDARTSQLEFTNTVGGGYSGKNIILSERGRVDVVNTELFKYQQDYGATMYGFQGRAYEFSRQSRLENQSNIANVVGTWKRVDTSPSNPGYNSNRTVTLKSDGTYQDTNHPGVGGLRYGEYRYQYKNGILRFAYVRPNGEELLYELGRVDWVGPDRFNFHALDGIDSRNGATSEFDRIESSSSESTPNEESESQLGSGSKGDLIGVWEGVDANGKQAAVVEFHEDGTCQTTGGQIVATKYEFKNPLLSFLIPKPVQTTAERQFLVTMQGTVDWVSGSFFKYKMQVPGQQFSGRATTERVIEFYRQSGQEDSDFVRYLVGKWECNDFSTKGRVGAIELNSDGTFHAEGIFATTGTDQSGYRFKYKDRILSFVWMDARFQEWPIERGRVDRIDNGTFHFKVLDGPRAAAAPPTGYEFRRQ